MSQDFLVGAYEDLVVWLPRLQSVLSWIYAYIFSKSFIELYVDLHKERREGFETFLNLAEAFTIGTMTGIVAVLLRLPTMFMVGGSNGLTVLIWFGIVGFIYCLSWEYTSETYRRMEGLEDFHVSRRLILKRYLTVQCPLIFLYAVSIWLGWISLG